MPEVVELLAGPLDTERWINVEQTSVYSGRTPLDTAIAQRRPDVVPALIRAFPFLTVGFRPVMTVMLDGHTGPLDAGGVTMLRALVDEASGALAKVVLEHDWPNYVPMSDIARRRGVEHVLEPALDRVQAILPDAIDRATAQIFPLALIGIIQQYLAPAR